jgi:hypothetical protein
MSDLKALLSAIKSLKGFKALLTFPRILKDVTVGLLLGDGSLQRRNPTGGAAFRFAQSYIHLEYFSFVFLLFSIYCGAFPVVYEHLYPDGSVKSIDLSFQTLTFP